MQPCPKHFPWYLRQRADPLRLRQALSSITACSHASPDLACARTPVDPVSGPMSGGQIGPYTEAPRVQQLGPPRWPADIMTPAKLTAYRTPFASKPELYVLSPEAAQDLAL
eukprot:14445680-Alexandrium_andersonii.AAC.1